MAAMQSKSCTLWVLVFLSLWDSAGAGEPFEWIYTSKKSSPKLYAKIQITEKELNALGKRAADYANKTYPQCIAGQSYIEVSLDRSTKKAPVFWLDCATGSGVRDIKRYYISELDIDSGATVSDENAKAVSEEYAFEACESAIKNRLHHPSTYSANWDWSSVLGVGNGNRVVTGTFEAKNSFNLTLTHSFRCLITPQRDIELSLKEKL
jgi:hypothetical protein